VINEGDAEGRAGADQHGRHSLLDVQAGLLRPVGPGLVQGQSHSLPEEGRAILGKLAPVKDSGRAQAKRLEATVRCDTWCHQQESHPGSISNPHSVHGPDSHGKQAPLHAPDSHVMQMDNSPT
jgi:hypothetical protein